MRLLLILAAACAEARALPALISGHDLVSGAEVQRALKGQAPSVVVFLSSHCPCSASHEEMLGRMARAYPAVNFVGVHSNADEDLASATEHFKASKLPFAVVQDQASEWANAFGALKTPHAFVLSPEGEVLYRGGVSDSSLGPSAHRIYLEEVLKALADKKPLPLAEGRTLGCYIRR